MKEEYSKYYEGFDKDRQSEYLAILIWHTVFFVMYATATFFLDWDKNILVFLICIKVLCWCLHFNFLPGIQDKQKVWIYFFSGMMLFFFYCIHSTSLWDITPIYGFIQIVYFRNREKRMVVICTIVYFITLVCIMLGSRIHFEFSPINIARLFLHCIIALATARMSLMLIAKDLQNISNINRQFYELEEMNRMTVDFLANVSHELRTPINVITGTSTIILKTETDPKKKRSITFMHDAGDKLFTFVDEILDYAEVSSEKSVIFEDEYVFLSMVNDIVTESRAIPLRGDVELIFDVDPSIPSVLVGDSKKIKKVLYLLIDNAIKFTNIGAVYVKIRALPKHYGINLFVEVRDTGKGIEEENISKIASGFYQGNSGRDRSTGGLGLGLPIAYGLVSTMKGFIRVESEVGKGTTFTISIPQRIVDSSPSISASQQQQSNVMLALFLRQGKYTLPEVKFFYNETIRNMVVGLEIPLHRVFDLEELKKLVETTQLTHLFIGQQEFEEDREYFESLSYKMDVIISAESWFSLPHKSNIKILHKPLWVLPVMNAISSGIGMDLFFDKKMRMVCPGVKILVVDDEPMNLMITEGLLKNYQMNISFADSGKQAIEMCANDIFDVIFLDHMMPEMDGVETMRRLKMMATKEGIVLRVVAFTANVISSAREMFIKEGFAEFLSKPLEISELERVLKKVLPSSMISFVEDDSDSETPDAPIPVDILASAQPSDGFALLEGTGINMRAGLGYCSGDKGFYIELLLKFANDAPEKMEKIEGFYGSRDFENYHILVHALKSTAKMIGAESLSDAAKSLEDAAKNNEVQYIENNHAALMLQYAEVTKTITTAFGKDTAPASSSAENSEATSVGSKEEISKEDFLSKLNELKQNLATFEADKALELIGSMAGMSFGGKPIAVMLEAIRQDIDGFDFSAAQEKLNALILDAEGKS